MFKTLKDKLFGETPAAEPVQGDVMQPQSGQQPIVMYSTRFCPYCMRARSLLETKGWEFQDIAVDGDHTLRNEMIERAGQYTVPQIWIGEQHIGGCDELHQLERAGQLEKLVKGERSE